MAVQETPVELAPGAARSAGPSVQDILDRERVPVPDVLRRSSYYYMGSDDLPKERWYSKEFHDLEVEKVWSKTWLIACREDRVPVPRRRALTAKPESVCQKSSFRP